ncbi:addiction module toxin, RelE/StbE family [Clostridia bacterium]|nr:addiction module toxin, RelE/StbE family [Clostridia bacterium]
MLDIQYSNRFKKEYKAALKRGCNPDSLNVVLDYLVDGKPLPAKYKDHALIGNWKGYRDCHIEPDWLLIYKVDKTALVLVLARTGTHSDLLGI